MIFATAKLQENDFKVYRCIGFLSHDSAQHFIDQFDYQNDPPQVSLNLRLTRVLGQRGAMALAIVILEYQHLGKQIASVGLDADTRKVCDLITSIQANDRRELASHLRAVLADSTPNLQS
jgi:sulfate permease, SulP family